MGTFSDWNFKGNEGSKWLRRLAWAHFDAGYGDKRMVRTTLLIMAFVYAANALADDRRPIRHVNLNAPGALEKVKESNPRHYETFVQILDGLNERPPESVARWMQTSFQARNVYYSPILLTSYPPLRDLTFTLDNLRYYARVRLASEGAKLSSR